MKLILTALILLLSNDIALARGNYQEALDYAEKAAYKQSGLEDKVNRALEYGRTHGTKVLSEAGLMSIAKPAFFIGNIMYKKSLKFSKSNIFVEANRNALKATLVLSF